MRKVEPHIYSKDYFLKTDGAEYFSKDKIAPKFHKAARLGNVRKDMRALDIGCGRGDLVGALVASGARIFSLDYSRASIEIAKTFFSKLDAGSRKNITLLQSDATCLGFKDHTLDVIFMVDIVEHLYPEQLHACLKECHRLLKPDGRLVIHTSPNKWYNDFGYPLWERPLNRVLNKLFKQNLLTRPIRTETDFKVHVNEQTLIGLKRGLRKAGFASKIWLGDEYVRPVKKESFSMRILEFSRQVLVHAFPLSLFPPLSYLFSNNIWAVATRKDIVGR